MMVTIVLLKNCDRFVKLKLQNEIRSLIFLCLANFIIISCTVIISNFGIGKRVKSTDTNKNTRYYGYSMPSTGTRLITSLFSCYCGYTGLNYSVMAHSSIADDSEMPW